MLLIIQQKSFDFLPLITQLMLIWLTNSSQNIQNICRSEDFHYLHRRLVAHYPGHVTTYFRTQCQRLVHLKDLICDIWHSMKIKYPYTKPQSPTPFNSNSHPSHFCTKLVSKTTDHVWCSLLTGSQNSKKSIYSWPVMPCFQTKTDIHVKSLLGGRHPPLDIISLLNIQPLLGGKTPSVLTSSPIYHFCPWKRVNCIYSLTCPNGHLHKTVTCLQQPVSCSPYVFYYITTLYTTVPA